MNKIKKEVVPINTRYPADVLAFLHEQAEQDGRSLNAQIIWVLREYMRQQQSKRTAQTNK